MIQSVKELTELDKQYIAGYLRNLMSDIMWEDGIVRKEADSHLSNIALPILANALLNGFMADMTEERVYLTYLSNILNQRDGKPLENLPEDSTKGKVLKEKKRVDQLYDDSTEDVSEMVMETPVKPGNGREPIRKAPKDLQKSE